MGQLYRVYATKTEPDAVHLPVELLQLIFENLEDDKGSLFSLALANSFCHSLAIPLLYRHITECPHQYLIINAIVRNPSLGAYVHSLHLRDGDYMVPPKLLTDAVMRIAPALTNLRALSVRRFYMWAKLKPLPGFIQNIPSTKLETLIYDSGPDLSDMMSFLARQPRLRHLEVSLGKRLQKDGEASVAQRGDGFGNLISLQGDRATIEAILPGRRVMELRWQPSYADTDDAFDHLEDELGYVEFLSITKRNVARSFKLVYEFMKRLKYLELDHMDTPEQLQHISELPELQGLILKCRTPFTLAEFQEPSTMARIFSMAPELLFLDLEHRGGYERWTRSPKDARVFNRAGILYNGHFYKDIIGHY
ncbi:hypothetical protein CVT24_011261 [Panaeolus cyanescens]|uniref:F-box domain-containing protein n=1 Tax=Panaeolus cyanescens TaxID=181874 RepID=A0A409VI45_9AGAR|nr:hypothetical protein CVT24_011261 [Panaeolus cyanescens]